MTTASGTSEAAALPVVAIVGRPNVGKSAVFNRIARRRLSIVHRQSGVTRDRVACDTEWGGQRFRLVDTGGLSGPTDSVPAGEMEAGIRRQVETAVREASALVLVTDVEAGVAPLDLEVADWLRRSGRPVFTAANKCDHPGRDADSAEFDRLAFPVYPVSALHDRGFDHLMGELLRGLPAAADAAAEAPAVRIAIVGRPNVGKSSLVNRLLREERVIVSAQPGTTVDSVDIPFAIGSGPTARRYVLTDTAGLRPKHKAKGAVEQYSVLRAERSVENADVVVLVIDALLGPSEQDKKIAALVLEHGRGCVLLVNKWDLAENRGVTQREYEAGVRRAVPFLDFAPVIFASASTGYNVRNVVSAIDAVTVETGRQLGTGALNRAIEKACRRQEPPVRAGKRPRIFYAVQVGVRPIRLAVFVSDVAGIVPAYNAYLIRTLRETFGLAGAPVILWPRERQREDRRPRSPAASRVRPGRPHAQRGRAPARRHKP